MGTCNATYRRSRRSLPQYSVAGAVITTWMVFVFIAKPVLSIVAGAACLIAKTALYFCHEKLWAFITSAEKRS